MVLITFSNFPDWIGSGQGCPVKPVEPAGISHVEDKRRLVGQSFGLWSLSQLAANFLPLCTPFKQLKVGLQWLMTHCAQEKQTKLLAFCNLYYIHKVSASRWSKICKNVKQAYRWMQALCRWSCERKQKRCRIHKYLFPMRVTRYNMRTILRIEVSNNPFMSYQLCMS